MPDPETTSTALSAADKHRRYLFPCVTTYYESPLTIVRGEGMHVWDDAGRRYLDCFGGVLTVSVGHCLAEVMPGGLKRFFPSNSGTEADETAVLLARVFTGQQDVLVLRYGYSGRSM